MARTIVIRGVRTAADLERALGPTRYAALLRDAATIGAVVGRGTRAAAPTSDSAWVARQLEIGRANRLRAFRVELDRYDRQLIHGRSALRSAEADDAWVKAQLAKRAAWYRSLAEQLRLDAGVADDAARSAMLLALLGSLIAPPV